MTRNQREQREHQWDVAGDTSGATVEPARADDGAARDDGAERAAATTRADRVRLALVVDDEPAVRAVVARHLIRLGWAVRALPSAVAALAWLDEAAEHDRPALVVSDVDMPGMSGLALAAVLRRDYPALGVLLLSGRAPEGLTPVPVPRVPGRGPAGMGASADAPAWLLGKPYALRALGEAVERVVLTHWGAPRVEGLLSDAMS